MEHGARLSARRITTAAEAAARDRAAIEAGTPSFQLMLTAGTQAAAHILRTLGDRVAHGVAVYAGVGNNGGDAYIVAAQLARAGVTVRLHASEPPRSTDAKRAAALAAPRLVHGAPTGHERLVVDGLLGTGHAGPLRNALWADCARLARARDRGATLVALDLPSGLDATTGAVADGSVPAHVTLSFGTLKRGTLLRREHVGRLVLLDIGLGTFADVPGTQDDAAWRYADAPSLHTMLAAVRAADHWQAHKGTRGRVAIAGGAPGMAGAVVLAARSALRTGAGLVHGMAHEASIAALQALVPQALAHPWPPVPTARRGDQVAGGAGYDTPTPDAAPPHYDALAVGPGLGRGRASAALVPRLLDRHRGTPLVLDADALWLAADAAHALGTDAASLLRHWTRDTLHVVCTPHPGEFARLLGRPLPTAWDERATLLAHFASRSGCTVLLKGTPTLIAAPDGAPLWAVPHGTPLLATGGSGDCLTGIIATLLAQGVGAREAAVAGATVHGRAAERATATRGTVRGASLDDVLEELGAVMADAARETGTEVCL